MTSKHAALLKRLDRRIAGKRAAGMRTDLTLLMDARDAICRPKPGPQAPIPLGPRVRVRRKLQKSEREIVRYLETDRMRSFTLVDIVLNTDSTESTAKNCLTRLVRDGRVVRWRRGFYHAIRGGKRGKK